MTKHTGKLPDVNPLQAHIKLAQSALSHANKPLPPDVAKLYQLRDWVERAIKAWETECRTAVLAYNEARLKYFYEQVARAGLAWCSHGEHLVPANQLRLVRESGAYQDSDCNYSKYSRSYNNVFTACLEHAITLKTTQKGVAGQYDYQIDATVCAEWQAHFDSYKLVGALVKQYSIPPEMKIIEGERLRIKLGKIELCTDINLPETRP